jgi:hypothetical protein
MKGFERERLFMKNTPPKKRYSLDTHSALHYIGHARSWLQHAQEIVEKPAIERLNKISWLVKNMSFVSKELGGRIWTVSLVSTDQMTMN